ncbi:hypothetical protein ACFL57_02970 [Candidatus Margulisiibacteriota bacterium]
MQRKIILTPVFDQLTTTWHGVGNATRKTAEDELLCFCFALDDLAKVSSFNLTVENSKIKVSAGGAFRILPNHKDLITAIKHYKLECIEFRQNTSGDDYSDEIKEFFTQLLSKKNQQNSKKLIIANGFINPITIMKKKRLKNILSAEQKALGLLRKPSTFNDGVIHSRNILKSDGLNNEQFKAAMRQIAKKYYSADSQNQLFILEEILKVDPNNEITISTLMGMANKLETKELEKRLEIYALVLKYYGTVSRKELINAIPEFKNKPQSLALFFGNPKEERLCMNASVYDLSLTIPSYLTTNTQQHAFFSIIDQAYNADLEKKLKTMMSMARREYKSDLLNRLAVYRIILDHYPLYENTLNTIFHLFLRSSSIEQSAIKDFLNARFPKNSYYTKYSNEKTKYNVLRTLYLRKQFCTVVKLVDKLGNKNGFVPEQLAAEKAESLRKLHKYPQAIMLIDNLLTKVYDDRLKLTLLTCRAYCEYEQNRDHADNLLQTTKRISSVLNNNDEDLIPTRLYCCLGYCFEKLFLLTGQNVYWENMHKAFTDANTKDPGNTKATNGLLRAAELKPVDRT